ncbi:hypothetical protein ACFL6M_06330 [Candidatus Eisenbacteria bacterium]|uniref:Band 7 domain-containing protein n=1 Tax=Eiseniibacteriota bacterium TaxID=2212470 RepID=A0ABV6YLJ3_UNCEI
MRIEAEDVPGFFKKELCVESGFRVALLLDGHLSGEVPPGWHTLGGVGSMIAGPAGTRRATAVIVDAYDTELHYTFPNLMTLDPVRIRVGLSLVIAAHDLAVLNGALLRHRRSIAVNEVRDFLRSRVREIVAAYVRCRFVRDLVDSGIARSQLESELARGLAEVISAHGLSFRTIRCLGFTVSAADEVVSNLDDLFRIHVRAKPGGFQMTGGSPC